MPIPQSHLKTLNRLLYPHELLVKLGRDPRVLKTIAKLRDDPKAQEECARNPTAFMKARGVVLPPRAKVVFAPNNWSVKVSVPIGGGFSIFAGYDSDKGFSGGVEKKSK